MSSNISSNFEMKEIIFYKTDDGAVKIEILLENENLWLTQKENKEIIVEYNLPNNLNFKYS